MNNKNAGNVGLVLGIVLGLAVLVGLVMWLSSSQSPGTNNDGTNTTGTSGEGNVVIFFADETAKIANVTEVTMKVSKVDAFSSSRGWVNLYTGDADYNLLALKASGQSKFYSNTSVPAGTYSRVRITLKDVSVQPKTGTRASATVPSKEVDIPATVRVSSGAATGITFDVKADQSLHTTTSGMYLFAPVIGVKTFNNVTVTTYSDGSIALAGGQMDTNIMVGMDLSGTLRAGYLIPSTAKLQISATGTIISLP